MGFRLQTLLRLPDIKASDRKTSLLQFITSRALVSRPSLAILPQQLNSVKGAAAVPFSSVSNLIRELQAGMEVIKEELIQLHKDPEAAGGAEVIRQFVSLHECECAGLTSLETDCMAQLRDLCETYFGETFDIKEPTRTLVVLRDFLGTFGKALSAVRGADANDRMK